MAASFLKLGKEELGHARGTASAEREREAAEKVFHALLEALTARVQAYTTWAPTDHTELRKWLYTKQDTKLAELYADAYLKLHVKSYYRGWIDRPEVDSVLAEIDKAITRVIKEARR